MTEIRTATRTSTAPPLVSPAPLVRPSLVRRSLVQPSLVSAPLVGAVKTAPVKPRSLVRRAPLRRPDGVDRMKNRIHHTVVVVLPPPARWSAFCCYDIEYAYGFAAGEKLWDAGDTLDFDGVAAAAASEEAGYCSPGEWCEGLEIDGEHVHPIGVCALPAGKGPEWMLDGDDVIDQHFASPAVEQKLWAELQPLLRSARELVLDDPQTYLEVGGTMLAMESLRLAGREIEAGLHFGTDLVERALEDWLEIRDAAADLACTKLYELFVDEHPVFAALQEAKDRAEDADCYLKPPELLQVGLVRPEHVPHGLLRGDMAVARARYHSYLAESDAPRWCVGWREVEWQPVC